mgnify:CR=1 FL=1
MNKLLVVDVDGVCLDWHSGFISWVEEEHGILLDKSSSKASYDMETWFEGNMSKDLFKQLVVAYNSSPRVLKPLEYSQDVLINISRWLDWDVVALTAFGSCPIQSKFREEYLQVLYKDIFSEVIVLGLGASKKDKLKELKPDLFVEDNIQHAESARDVGVKSVLLEKTYNKGSDLLYAKDWLQIMNHVRDIDNKSKKGK